MRKTDSPGNNDDKTLSGIIGTVVIILLICVIGLFLWKTCVKKRKMTTGRGRLHFYFLPQVPPPVLNPWLPSSCILLLKEYQCRRGRWVWAWPWVHCHGGNDMLSRLRFKLHSVYVCDSGAASQEDHRNQDDGDWAEQSQEEYQQGMYQVRGGS